MKKITSAKQILEAAQKRVANASRELRKLEKLRQKTHQLFKKEELIKACIESFDPFAGIPYKPIMGSDFMCVGHIDRDEDPPDHG